MTAILIIILIIFIPQIATAQDQKEEIGFYKLEESINFVITATKKKQKIHEAPAIISVISAQQIKDRGYRSVGAALESVAGLYLLHDHLQYNLGIRGVNGGMRAWSRIVKVMIDGQPVSFRPSSENFLGEELIPIHVVERIEIIRGPGSALYGYNAFLGVINIITKSGEQVKGGAVSGWYDYGAHVRSYGSSIVVGSKLGSFDFIMSGSLSRSDKSGLSPVNVEGSEIYSDDDETRDDISRPQSYFAKFQYKNESIGRFGIDLNYQQIDSYAEFQDWGVLTHNNRVSFYNTYIRGKYSSTFLNKLDCNLSVAYAEGAPTDREKLDVDSDTSGWIKRDLGYEGIDLTAEFVFNIDKMNNISIGFDFINDKHTIQSFYPVNDDGSFDPNPGGTDFEKKDFRNIGWYLQTILYPFQMLNMDYLSSFGLTAGVRYDMHNIYENVWNYRIGCVYNITSALYTKLLYGTSFKAPSSTQLYTNYIKGRGVIGNPDLKPEKAKTVEWAIGGKLSRYVGANVNLFYSNIKNMVEIQYPIGAVENETAENVAEINSAGIESEIKVTFQNLSNYFNYSFQRSIVEKEDPIRGKTQLKSNLYPEHMIKFGINYKIPAFFINMNIEGRYISKRIASEPNNYTYDPINYHTNRYELDSYFLLDCMVSTSGLNLFGDNETEIRFKVYNLLNEKYTYPGFWNYDIPGFERRYELSISQQF